MTNDLVVYFGVFGVVAVTFSIMAAFTCSLRFKKEALEKAVAKLEEERDFYERSRNRWLDRCISQSRINEGLRETTAKLRENTEERRAALAQLYHAFLNRHGCFPLDRTDYSQRLWNDAMTQTKKVLGE